MKPKLARIFLFIIIAPLVLVLWTSWRLVSNEQEMFSDRINRLLEERLRDINANITKFVEKTERELAAAIDATAAKANNKAQGFELKKLGYSHHLARTAFATDKKGNLLYPKKDTKSSSYKGFYKRSSALWESGASSSWASQEGDSEQAGWYTWFYGEGLQFVYWRRLKNGIIYGIELNRSAFLAQAIAALPDTKTISDNLPSSRIVLTNAKNQILYQWGKYRPPKTAEPNAKVAVVPPLDAWNLKFFTPLASLTAMGTGGFGSAAIFVILAVSLLTLVVLIVSGVYFYRENTREIKEAGQRVSFVNRVAHELKTPLTNIRLYSEFLENEIKELASKKNGKASRYIKIVVAESERLSRLIHNVLTFSRSQHETLKLHPRPVVFDTLVRATIDQFKPSLQQNEIKLKTKLNARRKVSVDADAVQQIIGNLISNVEKYAASGEYLEIRTSFSDEKTVVIEVIDKGPGIPPGKQAEIFQPFVRLSNKLSDGVTGTGIGLSIVRELCGLHGGDIELVASDTGSFFRVQLYAPKTAEKKNENSRSRR